MYLEISFGLLACLLWGSTYLLPLILSSYDPIYIAIGRATVMGAVAAIGILLQKRELRKISRNDWKFAFVLTLIGNVIQCWFLMLSVELGGAVMAGVCFGLTPVTIAVIANERDRLRGKNFLPFKEILVPVLCILLGLILCNWTEMSRSIAEFHSPVRFISGLIFGLISTAMWTWYPIKNADWLLEHKDVSPVVWTNVQCVILLPLGILLYAAVWILKGDMSHILGDEPYKYVLWMLFAGFICSWMATSLWNMMSQRVPTSLVGQMLVFESIFSVMWAHIYDSRLPSIQLIIGMILMVGSIVYSLNKFNARQISV